MSWIAWIWLALMVLFLIVEAATVSMVSLWFAVGSLAALIVTLLGGGLWLRLTAFIVVSAVLLLLLRPLTRRYVTPKVTATNAESLIGTQGMVTIDIDNLAGTGQVKLGGMYWTARSTTGTPIPKDTRIQVDRIAGVKVFVTPVPVTSVV